MIALPIEEGFARLQHSFAQAIFFDDTAIPATIRAATGPASTSRFGVYRNNVIASLMQAIGARYPVVRKLLWDDAFNHVAKLYVTTEPPRSPVLLGYGESFPRFLRKIGKGVAGDYVADIAELEAARTRAYHAEDAIPIGQELIRAAYVGSIDEYAGKTSSLSDGTQVALPNRQRLGGQPLRQQQHS